MKVTAIAAGAAALVWSVMMSLASAHAVPAGAAPIEVLNVIYEPDRDLTYGSGLRAYRGLTIAFKDISSVTVQKVTFEIRDSSGHKLGTVSGHGTFSPGISINHYFGDVTLSEKHGVPSSATPVAVEFKDGTAWTPHHS
jgi:hypothetical protein